MRNDGATVTLTGRAATDPSILRGADGAERVSFRIVSNERRYDEATSTWVDTNQFGTTVVCWRGVAAGVLRTVRRGDPLLVVGRISTRRFERNNVTEYFTDVRGDLVALDVARIGNRIARTEPDRAGGPGSALADGDVPGSDTGLPAGEQDGPAADELGAEEELAPF